MKESVRAIIHHPEEPNRWLLLRRERRYPFFTLPGGWAKEGETHLQALERNLRYKIGLIVPFSAVEVHRMSHSFTPQDKNGLWVVFELVIDGNFTPKAGGGIGKLTYMNPKFLTRSKHPTERRIFACARRLKRLGG